MIATLLRGLRKRCPHCGQGRLFVRWVTLHARCANCGLVFIRDQGDTWLFYVLWDRVPIFVGIAAIYFGFQITHWTQAVAFFLGIAVPLLVTLPQRQGFAIAASYLSRMYFRDPSDRLPVDTK